MIVCASPAWPDAAETSYVLEFAQLTGQIETTVSENAPIYKGCYFVYNSYTKFHVVRPCGKVKVKSLHITT